MRTRTWDESYRLVIQFVDEHDRLPSMHTTDRAERRLGIWVHNQRISYRNQHSKLTTNQRQFLEILPGFFGKARRTFWERYVDVYQFVADHDRQPSFSADDPDEVRLAKWVSNQRERYRGNDTRGLPLSEEQAQALRKLPGFLTARDVSQSSAVDLAGADMSMRIENGTVTVCRKLDGRFEPVFTLSSENSIDILFAPGAGI